MDISRSENGLVYVKGPADLIKKYKNETKHVKTIRKMIKMTGEIKKVDGITATKKGSKNYKISGRKDKVEKYLNDNSEIDMHRIRINKKYNKEIYEALPTKNTTDLESFTKAITKSAYEILDNLIKKYKGIKFNFVSLQHDKRGCR